MRIIIIIIIQHDEDEDDDDDDVVRFVRQTTRDRPTEPRVHINRTTAQRTRNYDVSRDRFFPRRR